MKKRNQLYRKGKQVLIGGGICLLGSLASCSIDDDRLDTVETPQYGSAAGAVYGVNGKVTDPDNQPLVNILIEIPYNLDDPEPYQHVEKMYTDKEGIFTWRRQASPKDQIFRFIIKDIDGEMNGGEFKPDTIDVKFSLKQLSDSGGNGIWDYGSATEDIHVKLNKKK